jgi:MtN3 and saliva related transmembrane protein
MQDVIGWLSSLVLFLTLSKQIYKQWSDHTSAGVSKWLYIGQMVAEAGFVIYSLQVHSWPFVVTNGVLFCTNAVGLAIVYKHRSKNQSASPGTTPKTN